MPDVRDPDFSALNHELDEAQVTMRRCAAALRAMTEASEETGDLIIAGQCGLVYAAIERETERVTDVSNKLWEHANRLKETAGGTA